MSFIQNLKTKWQNLFADVSASRATNFNLPADEKAKLQELHEGVVIGKILEIRPHSNPKMTKVQVTQTEIAPGVIKQILCGAGNIAVGQIVPVATVGTPLSADFIIGERDIRGETSSGMICAKNEIGLFQPDHEDGIWDMPVELEVHLGTPLRHL